MTRGTLTSPGVRGNRALVIDPREQIFNYDNYGELLFLVRNSLVAGAMLGLVGGIIGTFVMMRDLAFAVHGVAELSFAGASAALLIGVNVAAGSLAGSIVAALIIGALGVRARDRNSIIGVLMPFGLGLGVLFLALYKGRAANKFGLLTGQIVAVDTVQMTWLVTLLSVVFALTSMLGGILLALGSSIPISPYVTTISFTIYLACRGIGALRTRTGGKPRGTPAAQPRTR
ncbi:metal ABC transporter permease [Streptosporangium sp. NPDC023825]|uniref:metal ABC transporter permease n=1 Tax=Streptosporangium sp. NPDC023825 TaxID=3154909 RepID=UPI00341D3DE1